MIRLIPANFARAAEKAQSIQPTVTHDGATYRVIGGDNTWRTIRFVALAGSIWARCDCRAGRGYGFGRVPQPCYHVAAAVLFGKQHSHNC
jgi:hypothetical protein